MSRFKCISNFCVFLLHLTIAIAATTTTTTTKKTTTKSTTYPNKQFPVTIVLNPCAVNPCLNGRCQVMVFGAYCSCDPNYTGPFCDKRPDTYCTDSPCKNNATCRSTAGFAPYTCQCQAPYTGQFCDTLTNIDDVDKIDLNEPNSQYLLNQTLDIIKIQPNLTNTTLVIVSDLLANVSTFTKQIENSTPSVFFEIFDQVVENANAEKSNQILESTQKLSKSLENYIIRINLTEDSVFKLTTDNIAILSYKVNSTGNDTFNGFAQKNKNSSDIELVSDPEQVDFNKIKASAFLSQKVLSDAYGTEQPIVSFAVYEKSTMFDVNSSMLQYPDYDCSQVFNDQIVSSVISVSTDKKITTDAPFVRTLFRSMPTVDRCLFNGTRRFACVFWDYKNRVWNSTGCTYSTTAEDLHACSCNHLTNFAVLMSVDPTPLNDCTVCSFILKYASYAGSIASILSLSVLILVYSKDLIKKKLTRNRSLTIGYKSMFDFYIQVLISLSFCLLFMNMFYIVFSTIEWTKHGHATCITIAVLLHYFLLSSFAWMLSFAVLQYLTFNKVFVMVRNYYLWAACFSLLSPLIPIGVILGIDWRLYESRPDKFCWLSGYSSIFGVVLPVLTIVVLNILVFALILKKHCNLCYSQSEQARHRNIKKQTIILGTSFVNLGLTWSMAFLLLIPMDVYAKTAVALLFCVFNSLQGFFLFLVYIVLTKSKRQLIKESAQEKFRQVKNIFSSYTEANRHLNETSISSKNTSLGYNQSSIITAETISVTGSILIR